MPDRRTVDDLTIEDLEQILIVKRREARAERMRRLQEIGRVPVTVLSQTKGDAALPHEDLAAIGPGGGIAVGLDTPDTARQHPFDLEPLAAKKRQKNGRKRPPRTRWGRLRDGLLLILEVGALLGLVAILATSLLNLKSLNAEYAQAGQLLAPTPTPLAGGILPGEHQPPEEVGSVPVHLRDLVEGQGPPGVPIPTPGPEAPTRVVIPAINVDALVVPGDSWEQLKLGVGHHLGSANPGERGNMVLSAHDDIYGEIFRYLDKLELGDEVIIYAGEQPFHYLVMAKQIVEPTEVRVLGQTTKPVATLITCYPYMVNTHRVIVIAELQ